MSKQSNIEIISPIPVVSDGVAIRVCEDIFGSARLRETLDRVSTDYVALCTSILPSSISADTLHYMTDWLDSMPEISMVYANYVEVRKGKNIAVFLNEPEKHVLRDSFDFGLVLVARTSDAQKAVSDLADTDSAAFYGLTLGLQRIGRLVHSDMLAGSVSFDNEKRDSGQRQFDYVDPRNAANQLERERLCFNHLKAIGALANTLSPKSFMSEDSFPVEASVIIPVKNRHSTIADAVRSALSQQTDFDFNIIIVDNHSDDGTTDVIASLALSDKRICHLIPEEVGLGIGGCWNYAVQSNCCGRYAVQLDSDDLYFSNYALQTIIDKLRSDNFVLVVGSYKLVDFSLSELPPGIIDHREWTDKNGPNNILRINGMGAPRAFDTSWLRLNPFPNVSYGEDYAAVLCATRQYRVGRIYDVLYLCRRWVGNSDSGISPQIEAAHNAYKDSLRSAEVELRIAMNR